MVIILTHTIIICTKDNTTSANQGAYNIPEIYHHVWLFSGIFQNQSMDFHEIREKCSSGYGLSMAQLRLGQFWSNITNHFSGPGRAIGHLCGFVCLCGDRIITFEWNKLWPRYLARRFIWTLSIGKVGWSRWQFTFTGETRQSTIPDFALALLFSGAMHLASDGE